MATTAQKRHSKTGYLVTIIIDAILIIVFNNLLNWGVPFLTGDYAGIIWAFDLSLGATILLNITYLVYDGSWYRHLGQMVLCIIALFVLYLLIVVFPFTFAGESWAFWVKLAFILGMVGTAIGFIVEIVKLITGKD